MKKIVSSNFCCNQRAGRVSGAIQSPWRCIAGRFRQPSSVPQP